MNTAAVRLVRIRRGRPPYVDFDSISVFVGDQLAHNRFGLHAQALSYDSSVNAMTRNRSSFRQRRALRLRFKPCFSPRHCS